jgi:phosphatidylserine decarboxylase
MICFGSRLDVFMPPGARLNCQVGDKVQAGTHILGYLK